MEHEAYYYRHYVRVRDDGRIIKGFSDAFEMPQEGDICINDRGGRQFELFGEINLEMLHDGIPLYRWDGEAVLPRALNEIAAEQETQRLAQMRPAKIEESKSLLADYLETHPLQSTAHGGEAAHYAVTAEKQGLLTGALMMAQGAAQAGIPYEIRWNATGQECEAWQLEELMLLAFEINAYVTPLISYQQKLEVQINACETVAELEAVIIDYGSVWS